MAEETIGVQLINRIAAALENVSVGLADVDTNTADTKTAITQLNTDFITLFGAKSALSKLLLKEQTHSKSSKTQLSNINNKLGGIQTLIDINKKQLDELKKMAPGGPGLSGATKRKTGMGGGAPAADFSKSELEALLKRSNKGLGLGLGKIAGYGSLAAFGVPQMLYKAAAGLSTVVPILLAMHLGRDYAEGGFGNFGFPSMGGMDRTRGTGIKGGLGKAAVDYGVPAAALVYTRGFGMLPGARGAIGRQRMGGMARGLTSPFYSQNRMRKYVSNISKGSAFTYTRLSGYTGTKMTRAGLVHFKAGKIVGVVDNLTGKLVSRTPGASKGINKAFNKALGRNASKAVAKTGFRTFTKPIPFVGLLVELGFTVTDVHDLMTDASAFQDFKEEWGEAGIAGRGALILGNPAASIELLSDTALQAALADPTLAGKGIFSSVTHEEALMDPQGGYRATTKSVAGYTYKSYHKARMQQIKNIQMNDDGLQYPYGFPGWAPVGDERPGVKRYMQTEELLTQNLTDLKVISSSLKEVSTRRAYKLKAGDKDEDRVTWKQREQHKKSVAGKAARESTKKDLTYTTSANVDKIKGKRLAALWEADIIQPSDLPYMTDKNVSLLAAQYDMSGHEFTSDQLGPGGWTKHEQDKATMLSTDHGRAQLQKRTEDTQRIMRESLNANSKTLMRWLDRHAEIQDRTAGSPITVLERVGSEGHLDQTHQQYQQPSHVPGTGYR